jgi:hypothetical protein
MKMSSYFGMKNSRKDVRISHPACSNKFIKNTTYIDQINFMPNESLLKLFFMFCTTTV